MLSFTRTTSCLLLICSMCANVLLEVSALNFISKEEGASLLCHTEIVDQSLSFDPSIINSQLEFGSSITVSVTEGEAHRTTDFFLYDGLLLTRLTDPADGVGAITFTLPETTSAVAFEISQFFLKGDNKLEAWITINDKEFSLTESLSEGYQTQLIGFASNDVLITSVKFHVKGDWGETAPVETAPGETAPVPGDNDEQPIDDSTLEADAPVEWLKDYLSMGISTIRYGSNACNDPETAAPTPEPTAAPTPAPTPAPATGNQPLSPTALSPTTGGDDQDGSDEEGEYNRKLRGQKRRTKRTKAAN